MRARASSVHYRSCHAFLFRNRHLCIIASTPRNADGRPESFRVSADNAARVPRGPLGGVRRPCFRVSRRWMLNLYHDFSVYVMPFFLSPFGSTIDYIKPQVNRCIKSGRTTQKRVYEKRHYINRKNVVQTASSTSLRVIHLEHLSLEPIFNVFAASFAWVYCAWI
jgi:hypothetical protein